MNLLKTKMIYIYLPKYIIDIITIVWIMKL